MNKTMKEFIACLLLVALLGIIPSLLSAQQNQNLQKSDPEIEAIKKRVSELEKQLQTVENVEKLDLQAKLAEANAKLANAEFGKLKRELRNSNNEWLRNWVIILLAFLSAVGVGIWSWLKNRTNQLIETEVGKNIKGFKEAVKAQDVIKNQLEILERQYAASILAGVVDHDLSDEQRHPEQITVLREETLLRMLEDNETHYPMLKYKAAEVLAARKSPQLVSPLLDHLYLEAHSEPDLHRSFTVPQLARQPEWPDAVQFLTYMHTPEAEAEAYQGLNRFLNHLLTDDLKGKDWFLEKTVSSFVQIAVRLNLGDSAPILRRTILHLKNPSHEVLSILAEYFDSFNDPTSIKEILRRYLNDEPTNMTLPEKEVASRCLELVQKHDPEYVEKRRANKTTDNSEA